jgi:hypothetical protein
MPFAFLILVVANNANHEIPSPQTQCTSSPAVDLDTTDPLAIANAIGALEPWPYQKNRYSDESWLKLCKLAHRLTSVPPNVVRSSIVQFMNQTAFHGDCTGEWSKGSSINKVNYFCRGMMA